LSIEFKLKKMNTSTHYQQAISILSQFGCKVNNNKIVGLPSGLQGIQLQDQLEQICFTENNCDFVYQIEGKRLIVSEC